jgi:hypothetical protein
MTDHNSGAKEQAEKDAAGAVGTNVVPFPRSWYGSVDDLVPISPGPPPDAGAPSSLADASAFWGGDASQPGGHQEVRPDVVEDDPGAGAVEQEWREGEPDGSAARGVLPTVAFAVALITLLGVTAVVALSGRGVAGHGGGRAPARTPVLTVTRTVPQTTTVVQTITTRKTETVRHRSTERHRRPATDVTSRKQATAPATSRVQSPARSVPTIGSSSASVTPPARNRSTGSSAGGSKPSCAPSLTNGGACSL